jgi:UPF0716 protein FxsA
VGLAFVIALVCLPFVEIYLAIQVAHQIGGLATVALLVLLSASGPWLVKRQGLGVWRRARARAAAGEVPGREATDGLFLLIAGVLLTVPGFLTAALGILLLLPPVRAVVRAMSGRRLRRGIRTSSVLVRSYSGGRRHEGTDLFGDAGQTIDAEGRDVPPPKRSLERPSDH